MYNINSMIYAVCYKITHLLNLALWFCLILFLKTYSSKMTYLTYAYLWILFQVVFNEFLRILMYVLPNIYTYTKSHLYQK